MSTTALLRYIYKNYKLELLIGISAILIILINGFLQHTPLITLVIEFFFGTLLAVSVSIAVLTPYFALRLTFLVIKRRKDRTHISAA